MRLPRSGFASTFAEQHPFTSNSKAVFLEEGLNGFSRDAKLRMDFNDNRSYSRQRPSIAQLLENKQLRPFDIEFE